VKNGEIMVRFPQQPDTSAANGEVGVVAKAWKPYANVVFADRDGRTFGYDGRWEFAGGRGPLELAYAITVHKAQGSEFEYVFLILPRVGHLSRELIYTALTRSRARVVILLEAEPDRPWFLHELSSPKRSDTSRRNTRLSQRIAAMEEKLGMPADPFPKGTRVQALRA
jgi:ATP-dependent exoDNAse (exonuclease V) alpha subunit